MSRGNRYARDAATTRARVVALLTAEGQLTLARIHHGLRITETQAQAVIAELLADGTIEPVTQITHYRAVKL